MFVDTKRSRPILFYVYIAISSPPQISTAVEFPTVIAGALSSNFESAAEASAFALPLLYFSWALTSCGDQ